MAMFVERAESRWGIEGQMRDEMRAIQVKQLGDGVVQVVVSGDVDHEQASDIFQVAVMELYDFSCRYLVLDLRQTRLLDQFSMFKIYKLLHMFKEAVVGHRSNAVISVLYKGAEEKRDFLEKTVNDEGLRLRFFENPDNALLWFNDPMSRMLQ